MIITFCTALNVILVSGSSLRDQVYQTPGDMYNNQGETATIDCSHSIDYQDRILWYKQSKHRQPQFLGYMVATIGKLEKTHLNVKIKGNANKGKTCTLIIERVGLNSSAVYFCAVGFRGTEAYFGKGTKLTVLEPDRNVTSPTVTVLRPPANECKKKTIVCVASGFYPDHVSVSWQINGDNTSTGVATDNNAALQKDKYYSITSRLSVSDEVWFNPDTEFKCIVSFYNGTGTEYHPEQIHGDKAKSKVSVLTREKHLKITQAAKLSYVVFIFKSIVYGVFVVFLVWKLQKSTRKEN